MACTVSQLRASITTLYQPIVLMGLDHRATVGVEALSRGVNHEMGDADDVCVEQALAQAHLLPPHLDLFVNVHPASLAKDCRFPDFLAECCRRYRFDPSRLVVEILEHAHLTMLQTRQMRTTIRVMRSLGIRLAVDDVANAGEDLDRAIDLAPDYMKIDGGLIAAAVFDKRSGAQVARIVSDSLRIGAAVIAEGIEYPARVDLALEAGIRLLQGHYLGRPMPPGAVLRT